MSVTRDQVTEHGGLVLVGCHWPFKTDPTSSESILVHSEVKGYELVRVIIDSCARCNYVRLHAIASNCALYADALRESKYNGGDHGLAISAVVSSPNILIDLRTKLVELESIKICVVLDIDER